MPPVPYRHLLLHRSQLYPGRVEDVAVVLAPERLEVVTFRGERRRHARRERERLPVPMRTAIGRKDRPAERAEPPDEEWGGQRDDEVVRSVVRNVVIVRHRDPGRRLKLRLRREDGI